MNMAGNIFNFFKRTYKLLFALGGVILFFISYNTYLVDHSLDDLRLALTQTASAQTLEDTQSLKTVIDYALISELTAYKMNSGNLAGLTFTRNIVTKGKATEQIKDMESALKEIIKRREKQRGVVLTAVDKVMNGLKEIKNKLSALFLIKKPKLAITVDTSLIEKAKFLEESWKLPEAIENYELFIASYPGYEKIDDVRLRLAYCYEKSKDYPKAQKLYERIVKLSAGTKPAQIATASLIKIKEAQNLLVAKTALVEKIKLLKTTSELQDAYYQLGIINTKLLDFPSAQENFKKVVELSPDTQLALKAKFNLGWAYKFQNQIEESSNVFTAIAQEAPKSELAINSKYQVADNLKIQDKYEEALNLYKEIAQESKNKELTNQAQMQAGYTYLYDLNNPEAAKKEFEKASVYLETEVTKDVGGEHRLSGYELLKEGLFEEALRKFETATKLNPKDAAAYVGLSRVYEAMGKMAEAITLAEKGSQINANDEYIFATLGDLYTQEKRYAEAINAYRQAVGIRDDYPEALYNLGYLYNLTSQYDQAIQVLEKAVRYLPSYAEAYNNLGVAYWNKGRTDDALQAYKTAIKFRPDYPDALGNLGVVYKSRGQFEQAREMFLKVIRLLPNDLVVRKELEELRRK